MSNQPTTPPNDLRAMIAEALHAYELAQAMRIQMERTAQQKHQQHLAAAKSEQQAICGHLIPFLTSAARGPTPPG